ncbi:hypothetical protein [Pseudomonas putida]|uniref:hypothetical protein n=1 Tax=Pseudomonas putida TaxID=303 RepID=UPI003F8C77DB
MNLDFLFSPPILLVLSACLAMLLFNLFTFLISANLTRPVVFMLGLCFIGVGVLGHIYFLDMLERCRQLQASGNVSQDVLSRLERYQLVFAYMLPFVSGAIGTNVISDALLKHHTYERPFSTLQFLRDVAQIFLMPIGLAVGIVITIFWLVLLPIAPARRLLRSLLPKIWRWMFLRFFKLSIITRNNIRSVRGSLKPAHDDTP